MLLLLRGLLRDQLELRNALEVLRPARSSLQVDERGQVLGEHAGVHHFTTIGTLAFVGGMSRINRDVPPYMVVEGTPAEVRKVNTTALSRRKWSDQDIEKLRYAHKLLFREENLPAQTVVEMLRTAPNQPQAVLHLCDFVERAQLGVFGRQREADRKRNS